MSKLYKPPREYIEEITKPSPSIAAVETAIPAFIGYTQKAQKLQVGDLLNTPTRITSLAEYEHYFGAKIHETITVSIDDELTKTGNTISLDTRKISTKTAFLKNNMHYHLQLFFANGGGPCYIVSVGKPKATLNKRELKNGLDEVYQYAEPTLLLFPDGVNLSKATDLYQLYNDALMQAHELGDRFVIMDISHNDLQGKTAIELFRDSITGGDNSASLKYGAAYYPFLQTTIPYYYADSSVKIIHHTITREVGKEDLKAKGEFDGFFLHNPKLNGTDIYSTIQTELSNDTLTLSPSSAVAGIYASVDSSKGVWKAPANLSLSNIKAPHIALSDTDQEALKTDGTGKSINAIRSFTGKGTLLWGARTLAGNDNEWRYISVRRFYNMVEESVKKTTHPFVFEHNDSNTWVKVRAVIENFLTLQWQAGALAGAKQEHAFFVRVGLGQTMTPQDILDGRMIIEIGMAPVRPAEFIIIKIVQQMQVT
jgi:phage tail sheath protein FI